MLVPSRHLDPKSSDWNLLLSDCVLNHALYSVSQSHYPSTVRHHDAPHQSVDRTESYLLISVRHAYAHLSA
jgi:hypothetical protein